MSDVFHTRERNEAEKIERHNAARWGQIRSHGVPPLPCATPTTYVPPSKSWNAGAPLPHLTVRSASAKETTISSSSSGESWDLSWLKYGFFGMLGLWAYGYVAQALSNRLVKMGMNADVALDIGFLWLPILAAAVVLFITCRFIVRCAIKLDKWCEQRKAAKKRGQLRRRGKGFPGSVPQPIKFKKPS